MRITKTIPTHLIDIDRMPIHTKTLQYAICMQQGDVFPPVKLAKLSNGRYKLMDGRHRYLATRLNDRRLILGKFSDQVFQGDTK